MHYTTKLWFCEAPNSRNDWISNFAHPQGHNHKRAQQERRSQAGMESHPPNLAFPEPFTRDGACHAAEEGGGQVVRRFSNNIGRFSELDNEVHATRSTRVRSRH